MNWYLALAIFFTFMFIMYMIQGLTYNIRKASQPSYEFTIAPTIMPIGCAILSSIFWGLAF